MKLSHKDVEVLPDLFEAHLGEFGLTKDQSHLKIS